MPTLAYIVVFAVIVTAFSVRWLTPRVSPRTQYRVRIIAMIVMIFLVLAFAAVFVITP